MLSIPPATRIRSSLPEAGHGQAWPISSRIHTSCSPSCSRRKAASPHPVQPALPVPALSCRKDTTHDRLTHFVGSDAASFRAARIGCPQLGATCVLSVPWKAPIGVLAIPVMTMFSFSLMKFPFLNLGKRNWANFPLRAQTGIPEV